VAVGATGGPWLPLCTSSGKMARDALFRCALLKLGRRGRVAQGTSRCLLVAENLVLSWSKRVVLPNASTVMAGGAVGPQPRGEYHLAMAVECSGRGLAILGVGGTVAGTARESHVRILRGKFRQIVRENAWPQLVSMSASAQMLPAVAARQLTRCGCCDPRDNGPLLLIISAVVLVTVETSAVCGRGWCGPWQLLAVRLRSCAGLPDRTGHDELLDTGRVGSGTSGEASNNEHSAFARVLQRSMRQLAVSNVRRFTCTMPRR